MQGPCTADYQCKYNSSLTCDFSDNKCKCQSSNLYWSASLLQCLTYRNYAEPCDSVYLCNLNQANLTCYSSSACNCPNAVANNSCDCPSDQYFDSTLLGNPQEILNETFLIKLISKFETFV